MTTIIRLICDYLFAYSLPSHRPQHSITEHFKGEKFDVKEKKGRDCARPIVAAKTWGLEMKGTHRGSFLSPDGQRGPGIDSARFC